NRTNSVGVNFRNSISPQLTTYGGYIYTDRKNITESSTTIKSNFPNYAIVRDEEGQVEMKNRKHRLIWNLESNINSRTYFKISPTLSYLTSEGASISRSVTKNRSLTTNRLMNSTDGFSSPSGEIDLLFNHRFEKVGRRFSLSVKGDILGNEKENTI